MLRRPRAVAAALLVAACARAAGGQEYEQPSSEEALRADFWAAIARLEKRHRDNGEPPGEPSLAEQIRRDVGALDEALQREALSSFLRISHHYRAAQDPRLDEAARALHQREFRSQLEAFSQLAVSEYAERGNPALVQLFSHLRDLAVAGPEGLRLSIELARVDPKNALIQMALARDRLAAGQPAAAAAAAARAVELAPEDPRAQVLLARSRYALKEFPAAYDSAKRAVALAPRDELAVSTLQLIKGRVELPQASEKAMELARSPLRASPSDSRMAAPAEGSAPKAGAPAREPPVRAEEYAAERPAPLQAAPVPERVLPASLLPMPVASAAAPAERAREGAAAAARAEAEIGPPLERARTLNRERKHREALVAAEAALALVSDGAVRAEAFYQEGWALAGLERRNEALYALARAAALDERFAPLLRAAAALPLHEDLADFFADADSPADGGTAPPPRGSGSGAARLGFLLLAGAMAVALLLLRALLWIALRKRRLLSRKPASGGLRFPRALEVLQPRADDGTGPVYEAFDHSLQRRVALKRLYAGSYVPEVARRRALREATLAAGLEHPNIVRIYSVVNREPDIWLVLELVEGAPLAQVLARRGPLPLQEALSVAGPVAAALDYAHARGIVHGGLTPSNILLPAGGSAKVTDFVAAGSPEGARYKAPELEEGRFGPQSDVFSLGACLHEMLCGEPPFPGAGVSLLLEKISGRHPRLCERLGADLPGIDAVLDRALDPEPRRRWASAGEMAAALWAAALRPPTVGLSR